MGGCATKPKVSKDDSHGNPKAPQPQPEPQQPTKDPLQTKPATQDNLNVNEIVDEDQANKRRSLSLLFKEVRTSQLSPFLSFFFSVANNFFSNQLFNLFYEFPIILCVKQSPGQISPKMIP